jgi:hypothetical protein
LTEHERGRLVRLLEAARDDLGQGHLLEVGGLAQGRQTDLGEDVRAGAHRRDGQLGGEVDAVAADDHRNRTSPGTGTSSGLEDEEVGDDAVVDRDELVADLEPGRLARRPGTSSSTRTMPWYSCSRLTPTRPWPSGGFSRGVRRVSMIEPRRSIETGDLPPALSRVLPDDLLGGLDLVAAHLDDPVAGLPAGLGGRRVGPDPGDVGALVEVALDAEDDEHEQDREEDVHRRPGGQEEGALVGRLGVHRVRLDVGAVLALDTDEAAEGMALIDQITPFRVQPKRRGGMPIPNSSTLTPQRRAAK